jgi:hypothetical protein
MSSRTIRVTVRVAFDALTDAQRADLLADAAAPDLAFAAFTADGTLSHDVAARPFFTFRYAETVLHETPLGKRGRREAERAERP